MEMGQGVRVLAVVAHPDDEAWALSPVLVALLRGGADVVVCAATWGEAGVDLRCAASGPVNGEALARVRAQEFGTCAQRMGWRTGPGGGFADGGLERVAAADWGGWFGALKAEFAPSWWLTMAPDGGYGHRDHIALTRALVAWAEEQGSAQNVWGWCAPAGQARAMQALVQRVAPQVLQAGVSAGGHYAGAAPMAVLEDARHVVQRALASHESQLPGGQPGRFFGAAFWREVSAEQRLMRLVPAAVAGEEGLP